MAGDGGFSWVEGESCDDGGVEFHVYKFTVSLDGLRVLLLDFYL